MRRLVIGCGYLGLRAARVWVARGDRVSALTRSAARAETLRGEGIEPIIGDILDPDSLAPLAQIDKVDTLLYAVGFDRAAQASRREVYVHGLANVLAKMDNNMRRMIYISSTSVYGQQDGEWIDESSRCEPVAENGQVCLEAERTAMKHVEKVAAAAAESSSSRGSFELNILRLAGIYGPDRLLRRIDLLRRNDPLECDPDAWLNLIHVDDAVAAIMACEECGRAGEVYLVCDDQPVPRREYYTLLASLVGAVPPRFQSQSPPDQEHSANATEGGHRPGKNKRCSNKKLHVELGVDLRFPTYETGLPHALAQSALNRLGGEA